MHHSTKTRRKSQFPISRRPDGWYITGVDPFQVDGKNFYAYGPYATRQEALDAVRGIERFHARVNRRRTK